MAEITARLRIRIRCEVGRGSYRCPVRVVAGSSPPTAMGETAHSTFRGGGECRSWYAARQAGYRVRYHRSTLEVTVGDIWLAAEWGESGPLAERVGLLPDAPLGIIADWMEERCIEGWERVREAHRRQSCRGTVSV